jgi:hypothetical protein
LEKRGEGRFYDDVLATKIPPHLPFPKGGISDIFKPLCGAEGSRPIHKFFN